MSHLRRDHRNTALALLCLAQLMVVLDISIVNIAIPSIHGDLAMASSSLHWLVTAYVLTYGGFLLVGGRLGDLYGRRRLLLGGLACFTLSSALGGLATGAPMLLAARVGQGLGGAVISPTILSFVTGLYPEGAERNRALGLVGAVGGAGFALGLVLGGLLTSTLGWRWVFFINLPIGMLVILLGTWLLPETRRERHPVPLPSAILATASLTLLAFTLGGTNTFGLLSTRTLGLLAVTGLLMSLLVVVERRTPHPLIPPGLLKHPSLAGAVLGATVFGLVTGPITFILTLYLQNIGRLDPLRTGLAFLPGEVTVFLAAYLAGRCATRWGSKTVMALGMVTFALGAAWLTRMSPDGGYLGGVLPGLLVLGLGIGSVNVAGSIAATQGVASLQHGIAAGSFNSATQMGTALGLALLTAVAEAQTAAALSAGPPGAEAAAIVAGYRSAMVGAAALSLAGLVGLYWIGRRRPV